MLRRDRRTPTLNTQLDLTRLSNEQQYHKLPVLNISRGGLCFSSSIAFDVDERIQLTVFKDEEKIHHALGRICYCTDQETADNIYGISFLDNYLKQTTTQK